MTSRTKKRPFKDLRNNDADLDHLQNQLDLSDNAMSILFDHGIISIYALLEKRNEFKSGSFSNVKKRTQEVLLDVCLWHDDFEKHEGRPVIWQKDFSDKSFSEFQDKAQKDQGATAQVMISPCHLFAVAKNYVHDANGELSKTFSEAQLEAMYEYAANEIIKALSDDLIDKCIFDVKEYAILWLRAIFNGEVPQFNIFGNTQSGKSTLKALAFAICEMVSLPLIVITKGVAESKDLKKKICALLAGCLHKLSPTGAWWKQDIEMLYVIADTSAQIKKAVRRIESIRRDEPKLKFALILDECDAMYRTIAREQKTEQAFDTLMGLGPALPIFISATPLPAWLNHICRQGLKDVTMLEIGTTDDYSGINNLRPLKDANKEDIFLKHGTLTRNSGFEYWCRVNDLCLQTRDNKALFPQDNENLRDIEVKKFPSLVGRDFIPYTDEIVMQLYDDALSDPHKKGVLLLDSTCPSVSAINNIFDKACCIQNHYQVKGKDLVIVIVVGKGIYVRRPGFRSGRFVTNKKTISEVIQKLDDEYGLDMPIFVFGYSKMRRCISYRSTERVPTHMVLMLGQGQSNENFIQAIGRATFNGLSTLRRNGHEYPIILTNDDDFSMARKYSNFMSKMHERSKKGDSPLQALMGQNELFTDDENFFQHTNRKTGQDKTLTSLLPKEDSFMEPSASQYVNKKNCYWNDSKTQKVLRAIYDLCTEESDPYDSQVGSQDSSRPLIKSFSVDEIFGMYNDTYQYNHKSLKKGELRKILTQLHRDVVVAKDGKDYRGGWLWKPKSIFILKDMLNPEYCEN